jgi:hypothetical protein
VGKLLPLSKTLLDLDVQEHVYLYCHLDTGICSEAVIDDVLGSPCLNEHECE